MEKKKQFGDSYWIHEMAPSSAAMQPIWLNKEVCQMKRNP
jgi:hypothetical protein